MRADHHQRQRTVFVNGKLQKKLKTRATPASPGFVIANGICITCAPASRSVQAPFGVFEVTAAFPRERFEAPKAVQQIPHRPGEILDVVLTLKRSQPDIFIVKRSTMDGSLQPSQVDQWLSADLPGLGGRFWQGRRVNQPKRGHLIYHHDKYFASFVHSRRLLLFSQARSMAGRSAGWQGLISRCLPNPATARNGGGPPFVQGFPGSSRAG